MHHLVHRYRQLTGNDQNLNEIKNQLKLQPCNFKSQNKLNMLNLKSLLGICLLVLASATLQAQKIVYSEPEKEDNRRMNFEIIGKIGGNFHIYKNSRNDHWVSIYNTDMQLIENVPQEYLPSDRLINVDFFPYADFSYLVYQYQRRNVVYCMGVKLDGKGRKMYDPVELDTTHISFTTNNKIYSTITSEDKEKIMVFKINSKNRKEYVVTTRLFDKELKEIDYAVIYIPMEERNDYLDEFHVDNEGDFVFTKFTRNNNDNISAARFLVKPFGSNEMVEHELNFGERFLDQIHIKVDNYNKRYFITSFFYNQRRGNIEGMYFNVWDQAADAPMMENTLTFSNELRNEARGDANIKMAFNDYFIRNIITKADGGFIIGSESYYTSSRGNAWNRWNYLYGSPFMSSLDYYYYYNTYPYFNSWAYRSRFGDQNMRHHADNIVVLSFNKDGQLQWSNVIAKEQFDDEAGNNVSYTLMNTGNELHFLFNNMEKRTVLLNDFTISPGGKINRNPTLKNLDKGFEFMPKYARQVSSKQLIVPCIYRNYICFAKIEYN